MIRKFKLLAAAVFVLQISHTNAQENDPLPRSTPEAENVSSAGIIRFIDSIGKSKNEFHSFMFLRHGKVIAEGWWDPYKKTLRHSLYSTSKTFTSTAIGFAVAENRLKLSDKVVSFFPNQLPDTVSANLAALTIQDVLMMSDGMDPDPSPQIEKFKDWTKAFLSTPVVNRPGTVFLYNSLGTYMLSAIIQKVTGQKEIDYLKPRLFDPLGITGMDWEENLLGINTGGWGLRVKTEDMAKLGQLYLQKGIWKGKQILPVSWIEEATSVKIIQHPKLSQTKKDSSDWEQGYGYQIWRCRHHAYRADGAFGQFIIVMPDMDVVVVIQAESADMQNEINLVWDYLLPAIKKQKVPDDSKSQLVLKAKLSSLKLSPIAGNTTSLLANKNFNQYFVFEPNDANIGSVTIQIKDSICHLIMNTNADTYNLYFGSSYWLTGQTNKPGPSLVGKAKENWAILSPYKVAGSFSWKDDKTLVMVLRYIESPHTETIVCHIEGHVISATIERSLDYGAKKTTLNGVLK